MFLLSSLFLSLVCTIPVKAHAWGAKGHAIVAEIAWRFLDDSTKQKIQGYLGNLTIQEAANWMDDSKSNSYFDYMRTWHYVNIDKGQAYKPSGERNSVTIIYSALTELKGMDKMKKKDIRRDLLLLFHLVGDMHQPLHNGYADDRGGNSISVSSQNFSANLHSAWDTQILETEGVTTARCLKLFEGWNKEKISLASRINVMGWMTQSRAHLDFAYNFKNGVLDRPYIDSSVSIIENQLLLGGIRLAAILREVFNPAKQIVSLELNDEARRGN